MTFFLLINVKMPILGILTFMSRKKRAYYANLSLKKADFLIALYLWAFEISCSAEFSMKFFYNLEPRGLPSYKVTQNYLCLVGIILLLDEFSLDLM